MVLFSTRLVINEGVAVDARLAKSASHSISKEKLEDEKQKRKATAGDLDKTGNILKFSRDVESDWTEKNDIPHFGLKKHAAVDTRYGFVLATEMTPASHHDSPYLPLCVAGSCHTQNPIRKVYADKGYFGRKNREFLHLNHIADGIMTKAVLGTPLTPNEIKVNKAISKIRYIVEQYFGLSHLHNNAFRARFTRLIKNAQDALFRQMVFNLLRVRIPGHSAT